ncbi:ankyrin repeat domain-containing protein 12 isoform X2 [Conger conger]|uniref:ankyrin repeat domain-containing protein 12 isoform X2 n=1 Tax=Conger conger TaxID=82655 RepID=UPI002A5A794F|nr:ankyrin repeat domain-containing protein 12 isoform X2 [Conger conger]
MAKPGGDRDGTMVEKQAGKKSKDKISPFTKTPKLDRSELLGREMKPRPSMKRKLSFTVSPPRNQERDSDTDKDGPDKKKVKKETGSKKSTPVNILFGYPLSERKQMALLMQMTARDNSPDSTPSHPTQALPVQKKLPSSASSRQKDKVNKRNERGETPLHMAAIRGDAKQVRELISLGADVNVKDFAGWTPLHEACNLGYYDVAKVLIAAGAEVNTQGLDDDTPLHDASSSGHKDIVKLLLRNGGNAFQANKRGERPVDVADSQELELLLKGEVPLSEPEDSSSESEDPPSVNPSSVDDNMEFSDLEKDSDGKQANLVKSSASMSGLDEYEFKDEEEEEEDDLSKALNDRHILRREQRQREKDERDGGHFLAKQDKGNTKSKKSKTSRVLYCSSDSSSDEADTPPERKASPTCSLATAEGHRLDSRTKKELSLTAEHKEKGKVKKKYKNQSKNKENQELKEDGKENSKVPFFSCSASAGTETSEKASREEDSFKMSFSPKDDSSVHLFHLPSARSPKLNHNLADKQPAPLKQENAKTCLSVAGGPCQVDGIKQDRHTEPNYATESCSSRGAKHKEKSKHHHKELSLDAHDRSSSPCKEDATIDSAESALRKTDKEGKVVKKYKLKHREKDKHRKDCEVEKDRHKQKEARKEGHRNLEFDREFWKENFFKSDENEEPLPGRTETPEGSSPHKTADSSPVKEEKREGREKHSSSSKDRRQKEDREKDKAVKKEKDLPSKEEKGKELRTSEQEERTDGVALDRGNEECTHSSAIKDEQDEQPVTERHTEQDLWDQSEKGTRDKTEKRTLGKERDAEKTDKKHSDKEKKPKGEHSPEKSELHNCTDRWKEREKTTAGSSHSPGDRNHKESEKLKAILMAKRPEENKKSRERPERKSEKEKVEKERSLGESRDRERNSIDKRGKPPEKVPDQGKLDRIKEKEKDGDKKKKEKGKDITSSTSNLKLLLEEKKSSTSESNRMSHEKNISLKLKEDVPRTPEKDRRERDKDADRHRDRDRHKDRSQPAKISKSKSNEVEADRAKPKPSPAPRDVRPKEKRLVNDDLMQTSFERMLSLKDQEIEQWHRKHMEKIKQKERERMKQRPVADSGKLKSKDRSKSSGGESCHSKELLRSKSSETSEVHNREKVLKDATSSRSFSLDAKCLPHSGKLGLSLENSLSRSPRPEGEKSILMSRSVSMISVASSEDSCQAAALTPRPLAEYDSDFAPEGSDSQLSSSQASFVVHPARSPAVHEKESEGLLDAAQRGRSTLPVRHASPYLRSILDEDTKVALSDGRPSEDPGKASTMIHSSGEHAKGTLPDSSVASIQDGNISQSLPPPSFSHFSSDPENIASGGIEGNTSKTNLPITSNSSDTLNKDYDEIHIQQATHSDSRQQSTTELKRPCITDPLSEKTMFWPPVENCRTESSSQKSNVEHNDKATKDTLSENSSEGTFSSPLTSQQTFSVIPQEPTEVSCEPSQGGDEASHLGPELQEKAGLLEDTVCKREDLRKEPVSAKIEWVSSPGPSNTPLCTSTHKTDRSTGDSVLISTAGSMEIKVTPEDMEAESLDSKDSKDSTGPSELPLEKQEGSCPTPSYPTGLSCAGPVTKAEDLADAPESKEKNSGVEVPEIAEPSSDDAPQTLLAHEIKNEPVDTAPDHTAPEENSQLQEQLEASGIPPCGLQGDPHTEHSSTCSGSSSPLQGEGDSLGAKAKMQPLEEEDNQVNHPRKRKMPRVSQVGPGAQQAKDKAQQSLAAIVDSLKLEEIQPYQTERANPYYEFLHIRRKIEEKRKVLCSVIPQAPQYYDEYVTFNGSYLLDGNPLSKLCIPTITPPPSLPDPLKEMFKQQEVVRMKLRLQHSIEREKLIVSNEQEVLRVHYRAARTLANQSLPFSACTVLLDAEVYNMPAEAQGEDGKTSVRDRFNARQFMSWLQDVDDKFDKLKTCLLMRQQHEAAALNAVQRLEWQLKLQELDPAMYKSTSIFQIPEFYIPLVEVNDDFDLTPI